MKKELIDWLETWAPNCGAPKSVFLGQFSALMTDLEQEICERAELKMQITNKLEGAHYAAMRQVFKEVREACK